MNARPTRRIARTVPAVMEHYGCDAAAAMVYLDMWDEGCTREEAALVAGLTEPADAPAAEAVE